MAQNVKVTPLGGIDGEFCPQDRALIFEDPSGMRILNDPGRTVAGATDSRLGKIDILPMSHMHGDHLGNAHIKAVKVPVYVPLSGITMEFTATGACAAGCPAN
ncbi:MAG: metal-dependent hydrolase [Variovorax sp.]|nr:metal-dependent hydrolase [Variovorax sp.]